MGLLDRIRALFTSRQSTMGDSQAHRMQARVDAAQTNDENRKHWSNADHYSADAAFDPATRFRLRNRSRYEVLNNCYAKQVVRASAADLIGTGPRLQLSLTPGTPQEATTMAQAAKLIERAYCSWADETHLARKLATAEKSRVRDGECFGIFDTNERLRNPVKFDVRWVEAEVCATPFLRPLDAFQVDGIEFDRFGNPVTYHFLVNHPGNILLVTSEPLQTYAVPSERVMHWYSLDRFGQHRAIPELTPSLPLYSQVRRYTLASLTAAEFAAMLAGVMKTNAPADSAEVTNIQNWTPIEMVRGALLSLPDGWEATQFKSESPSTSYAEFKRELLNESGCATGHPLNRVTGNSSQYNYSSGRLDILPYNRDLRIRRNDMRMVILDRILRDGWYPEALAIGIIPPFVPPIQEWRWVWNWDGSDSIDPNKDAMADDMRIKNGTSTYAEILAEWGQNWEEVFDQLAREKSYAQSLGLPWPIIPGAPPAAGAPVAPDEPVSPDNVQDAVAAALDEAKVGERISSEVMAALEPAFAALRKIRIQTPPVTLPVKTSAQNGATSNGHTFPARMNGSPTQALAKLPMRADAQFEEDKHPRDKNGKFGSGGGDSGKGSGADKGSPAPEKQPPGEKQPTPTPADKAKEADQEKQLKDAQDKANGLSGDAKASGEGADKAAEKAGISGWAAKLPDDEKKVVGFYQNTAAKTNKELRSDTPKWHEDLAKEIPLLDKAIDRNVTKEPITVYRGTNGGDGINFKVGESFTDHGFTSTTLDKSVMERFANKADGADKSKSVRMEIQVPAGSHVGYLGDTKSRYADEKEALLPRGGRYEVLSVDKGPNGTVVKLAYSPGEKRALPPKPGFFKRLLGVGGEEMFAEIGELTAADQPASEDRAERFTWRKDQIVMNG